MRSILANVPAPRTSTVSDLP